MYEYRATVIRVIDGDTLHLEVDLGFDVRRRDTFRLYGINAPEMSTPEGIAARDWLLDQLVRGPLVITTIKDKREKYGRYLAILWIEGNDINMNMVAAGHATSYMR